METIGQVIQQSRQSMQQQQQSRSSLQATNRTAQFVKFCEHHSPSLQLELCNDSDECFFGDYPTLAEIKRDYGKNAPSAWLVPQLTNLATYCGCRDKLDKEQYKECAFIIAANNYYLKVSELMLFFHRFKAGCYGRFYGSVDPLIITSALRQFLRERNERIARRDEEEQQRRDAEARANAITWEEYASKYKGE